MAWIESHTVLLRHRKLIELARELRLKPVYVLGHLHALWHVALEQQEDGDLSSWSDDLIAEMSGYEGDAPKYVSLLHAHGWLNNRIIHDWLDYAGKYLTAKYRTANPGKLKKILSRHKSVNSRTIVGRSPIRLGRLGKVGNPKGESEGGMSVDKLVELYNSQTPNECPAVTTISPARKDKARKYLHIFPKREFWDDVFGEIHRSAFLRGLKNSNGHEGFIASFDWLLTKGKDGTENAVKVAEGKYRDGKD